MACALAALWGMALVGGTAPAQARLKPSEDEVKAVYLFNFGKFVRWPASPAAPAETLANASNGSVVRTGAGSKTFDICILGRDLDRDPVTDPLLRVTANEKLGGLPVRVRQLESTVPARSCAIVYMGSQEAARVEQDLAALRGSEALTVSDQGNFLERGGMLQFVLEGDRVRFAVNLDAVGRTDLQLSSELLKVAARVVGKPHREVSP